MSDSNYRLLGATATSKTHGYTGKVIAVQYNLSCATQIHIQQPMKDDKIPDAMVFDLHMCDIDNLPETPFSVEEYTVKLGDQVEDIVTGFPGIVTAIICGINGCAEIFALSKVDDDLRARTHLQNHKRFKIITPSAVPVAEHQSVSTHGAVRVTKALTRSA